MIIWLFSTKFALEVKLSLAFHWNASTNIRLCWRNTLGMHSQTSEITVQPFTCFLYTIYVKQTFAMLVDKFSAYACEIKNSVRSLDYTVYAIACPLYQSYKRIRIFPALALKLFLSFVSHFLLKALVSKGKQWNISFQVLTKFFLPPAKRLLFRYSKTLYIFIPRFLFYFYSFL